MHLLVDVTIFYNGVHNNHARSGIFFVALNLLKFLFQDERLHIDLYCNQHTKEILPILYHYFPELSCKIYDDSSDFSDIEAFFSPVFKIPDIIHTKKYIVKYTFLYDAIPMLMPEYFPGTAEWFLEMTRQINSDDYYFAISEHTRRDFIQYVPTIDENKIEVIPLAANDTFRPCQDQAKMVRVRQKYHIPVDKPYILSLCSLEPRKNLIMALRAYLDLLKVNPAPEANFVLSGGAWPGFLEALEQELPECRQYRERIILTGYVDDADLAPLYSGALFFVYVSLYEGFGLPPLEAMQCGVPVITSNRSSLPEIVGDAALTVDPTSLEAHVRAFRSFLSDAGLRQRHAAAGLNRARQFSWRNSAKKMVDFMVRTMALSFPKITIITPVVQPLTPEGERHLRHCVESVRAQHYPGDIEHLVVDAAPLPLRSDLLESYVKQGWVRLHRTSHQPLFAALNAGIAHADGTCIAFLAPDSFYHAPEGLERMMRSMGHTRAEYGYGDVIWLQAGASAQIWTGAFSGLPFGEYWSLQGMAIKREVLQELQGFLSEEADLAGYELLVRLAFYRKKYIYNDFCYVTCGNAAHRPLKEVRHCARHAPLFYRWFGKACHISLGDCHSLHEEHFFTPPMSPSKLCLGGKLCFSEWRHEFFKRCVKSITSSTRNNKPCISRLLRYKICSFIFWGKRKKHYKNKCQNLRQPKN